MNSVVHLSDRISDHLGEWINESGRLGGSVPRGVTFHSKEPCQQQLFEWPEGFTTLASLMERFKKRTGDGGRAQQG